jgi:protein-S-isoprenylcysteine O-methyltransferase Ste14
LTLPVRADIVARPFPPPLLPMDFHMLSSARVETFPPGWRKFLVDFRVVISSVLVTALVASQWYVDHRPCGWGDDAGWQGITGVWLVLVGLGIRSWAAGILWKGKQLATTGPYSLCKHPLYLGTGAMVLGFCCLLNNPLQWSLAVIPIAATYWVTILNEERRMTQLYGRRWIAYSTGIPRFLPWRWSNYVHGSFSAACWVRNREYKAVLGGLCALAALEVWRLW